MRDHESFRASDSGRRRLRPEGRLTATSTLAHTHTHTHTRTHNVGAHTVAESLLTGVRTAQRSRSARCLWCVACCTWYCCMLYRACCMLYTVLLHEIGLHVVLSCLGQTQQCAPRVGRVVRLVEAHVPLDDLLDRLVHAPIPAGIPTGHRAAEPGMR